MKSYQSVKTQQKAGLLEQTETNVTLILDSGEQKTFSTSTFGRWWKEIVGEEFVVPETAAPAEAAAPVANATAFTEGSTPAAPADAATTGKKQKKSSEDKKRGRTKVAGDHPLRAFIEEYATSQGHTIFSGQVTGFRSVKVNDHMYMAFNFNTKGVTLQLRSKAIAGITEFKTLNHMFDARVTLHDAEPATKELVKKLMDASLAYQLNKPSKKKETPPTDAPATESSNS